MKNILCFVLGSAIGSVVTWKLIEKKYKDLADEEIASVVETFKAQKSKKDKKDISTNEVKETTTKKKTTKVVENIKQPYIITPEQYGEYDEYKTLSLLYLADDNLINDDNEIITEDRDKMLGVDALSHFGEYEDDSVYIRDEDKEIDYEILKSEKTYSEIQEGQTN